MTLQRIALDMDGVLADTYQQFFDWDERKFGKRRNDEEAIGRPEGQVFPNLRNYLYQEGFFRTLKVIGNSIDVVRQLYERYDLYIVSAATEFPQSLSEKQAWLGEHFSFITWEKIVFC